MGISAANNAGGPKEQSGPILQTNTSTTTVYTVVIKQVGSSTA